MKTLIKLEEIAVFLLCILFFSRLSFQWWWFPALLLLPDIGMLGYLINSKMGAFTYNFFHHRFVASVVAIYALSTDHEYASLAAIILFAHISFDRALGYGLKYSDGFHHTHLGTIGK